MSRIRDVSVRACVVALGILLLPDSGVGADVVLKGGTVVDGTGATARVADVAIEGRRIVAVGEVAVGPGARVIDVSGLVVAPGFIDLHTHSDSTILPEATRDNRNFQAQGVTTIVTGNCGGGTLDVARYFDAIDRNGAGANVIHLIPQGNVREAVIGRAERKATPAELVKMRRLVERGMEAGAWGMSSGLIYVPSRYADTDELIALAKVVSGHQGIYASHIRNEGARLLESVEEAIAIGVAADLPVHISHLKASGKANWGKTADACRRIERARADGLKVTADQYPYIASSTRLTAMVVPHWAAQGTIADFARIADDPGRGARLRREIEAEIGGRDGGASIRISRYPKDTSIVGLDLAAIATRWGVSPVEAVIRIERDGGAQAISFGMSEADVRSVMARDYVATASDASAHKPGGGDQPHPRAYGTFPRKIRYALDDRVITLEQAVRSCTGLPAQILGLPDRGTIRVDAVADLVVFDPKTFRDAATFDDTTRLAAGVQYLFIGGVAVIAEGKAVPGVRPGRSIRHEKGR